MALRDIEDFSAAQQVRRLPHWPMNGDLIEMTIFEGWKGSMTFPRVTSARDDLFAVVENVQRCAGFVMARRHRQAAQAGRVVMQGRRLGHSFWSSQCGEDVGIHLA